MTATVDHLTINLALWVADAFNVAAVELTDLRRHMEGFSWQTYTFTATWRTEDGFPMARALAVRRQPEDGLLAPYDIVAQYRLHEALVGTSVPVPALVGLEMDPGVLGMPFYAMDKVEGIVPVQWQGNDPSIFRDDDTRSRIGHGFVDALANIHGLDVAATGVDILLPGCAGTDPGTAELNRWETFLDEAVLVEVPILRAAMSWCRRNLATSGRVTLCHGDFRIGNFMLRNDRIVAVFDWELAHVGDPVEDLAWANLKLFRGRSELVSQLLPLKEFVARYTERTGVVVDDDVFRFWTVMGMIKAAAPHVRGAAAFEHGRSDDLRLAAMGHQMLHILRHLVDELHEEMG